DHAARCLPAPAAAKPRPPLLGRLRRAYAGCVLSRARAIQPERSLRPCIAWCSRPGHPPASPGRPLMPVRKYKPTSPGRRFMSVSTFDEVTKGEPEKSLTEPLTKKGGRNVYGRVTTRHQGGGHKRRYRVIDFKRRKDGVPAKVAAIEYDPNRSARIALLHYADGAKAYILAPARLRVGSNVESGPRADIKPGNALPLTNIPTGTLVHNVELKPGQG